MSYVELSLDPREVVLGDGSTSGDWIAGKTVLTLRTKGFCVNLRGTSSEIKTLLEEALERFNHV